MIDLSIVIPAKNEAENLPSLIDEIVAAVREGRIGVEAADGVYRALAPVVVPMFMLLGISPEMTTAAYRMGD